MAQACNGMRRKKGDNVDMKSRIMDIEANRAQNVNFHKDEHTSTPKKSARYQRERGRLKFEELVRDSSVEEGSAEAHEPICSHSQNLAV